MIMMIMLVVVSSIGITWTHGALTRIDHRRTQRTCLTGLTIETDVATVTLNMDDTDTFTIIRRAICSIRAYCT